MEPTENGTNPLILLDVDGVLNAFHRDPATRKWTAPSGYRSHLVQLYGNTWKLYLKDEHGPALLKLAEDTGGELAWGSMWEDMANVHISPILGLPELRFAPVALGRKRGRWKANELVPWTEGRPFVWFEDEPEERECAQELASAAGQPHLVIPVSDQEGLTDAQVQQAREWLLELPR